MFGCVFFGREEGMCRCLCVCVCKSIDQNRKLPNSCFQFRAELGEETAASARVGAAGSGEEGTIASHGAAAEVAAAGRGDCLHLEHLHHLVALQVIVGVVVLVRLVAGGGEHLGERRVLAVVAGGHQRHVGVAGRLRHPFDDQHAQDHQERGEGVQEGERPHVTQLLVAERQRDDGESGADVLDADLDADGAADLRVHAKQPRQEHAGGEADHRQDDHRHPNLERRLLKQAGEHVRLEAHDEQQHGEADEATDAIGEGGHRRLPPLHAEADEDGHGDGGQGVHHVHDRQRHRLQVQKVPVHEGVEWHQHHRRHRRHRCHGDAGEREIDHQLINLN